MTDKTDNPLTTAEYVESLELRLEAFDKRLANLSQLFNEALTAIQEDFAKADARLSKVENNVEAILRAVAKNAPAADPAFPVPLVQQFGAALAATAEGMFDGVFDGVFEGFGEVAPPTLSEPGDFEQQANRADRPKVRLFTGVTTKEQAAAMAKIMQDRWHGLTDREQFEALGNPPSLHSLLQDVAKETNRARSKYPGENANVGVLLEYVGKLSAATLRSPRAEVQRRAIQVAAMALRVILDGDTTLDAWRDRFEVEPLKK
jgi:hypothetical protein